jgi:DMSO reductase anchor subunit
MLALWPLRLPSGTATAAVLLLLLFGFVIKFHYYVTFKRFSAESPSVNEALKLGQDSDGAVQARVRMLDVGHTSGTFLTHEFGFELARRIALRLRLLALLLSFAAPIWLLLEGLPAWFAFAVCMSGLGVERWLFFAEARHVVRLYHG